MKHSKTPQQYLPETADINLPRPRIEFRTHGSRIACVSALRLWVTAVVSLIYDLEKYKRTVCVCVLCSNRSKIILYIDKVTTVFQSVGSDQFLFNLIMTSIKENIRIYIKPFFKLL